MSTLQCSRDMSLKSVNDKHAFYASVFGSVFFDIGNLSLTNIEYAPGRLHVHILKNLSGNNDEKKLSSFMEILYFLNTDSARII